MPAFDNSEYLAIYQEPLRSALYLLKYQKRLACATGFAMLWNELHQKTLQRCDADILIPVPLSQTKLATRGFNQAWEIAKRLQVPRSMMRIPNLITCNENRLAQAKRNRNERVSSMQDHFQIKQCAARYLKNKHVLIFDDVMTTGSTINAIATCLKQCGARQVTAWVVLRTLPTMDLSAI